MIFLAGLARPVLLSNIKLVWVEKFQFFCDSACTALLEVCIQCVQMWQCGQGSWTGSLLQTFMSDNYIVHVISLKYRQLALQI